MTLRPFLLRAVLLMVLWVLILAPATGSRDVFDTPPHTLLMAVLLGAISAGLWMILEKSAKKRRRARKRKKTPLRRRKPAARTRKRRK